MAFVIFEIAVRNGPPDPLDPKLFCFHDSLWNPKRGPIGSEYVPKQNVTNMCNFSHVRLTNLLTILPCHHTFDSRSFHRPECTKLVSLTSPTMMFHKHTSQNHLFDCNSFKHLHLSSNSNLPSPIVRALLDCHVAVRWVHENAKQRPKPLKTTLTRTNARVHRPRNWEGEELGSDW